MDAGRCWGGGEAEQLAEPEAESAVTWILGEINASHPNTEQCIDAPKASESGQSKSAVKIGHAWGQ